MGHVGGIALPIDFNVLMLGVYCFGVGAIFGAVITIAVFKRWVLTHLPRRVRIYRRR